MDRGGIYANEGLRFQKKFAVRTLLHSILKENNIKIWYESIDDILIEFKNEYFLIQCKIFDNSKSMDKEYAKKMSKCLIKGLNFKCEEKHIIDNYLFVFGNDKGEIEFSSVTGPLKIFELYDYKFFDSKQIKTISNHFNRNNSNNDLTNSFNNILNENRIKYVNIKNFLEIKKLLHEKYNIDYKSSYSFDNMENELYRFTDLIVQNLMNKELSESNILDDKSLYFDSEKFDKYFLVKTKCISKIRNFLYSSNEQEKEMYEHLILWQIRLGFYSILEYEENLYFDNEKFIYEIKEININDYQNINIDSVVKYFNIGKFMELLNLIGEQNEN